MIISALGASDSDRFYFVAFIVKHRVTVVVPHSIPSIMRLVTASLDYLRTLRQGEVAFFALFCCYLPSFFSNYYNFIRLLYSGDGIERSLTIGFALVMIGIIIVCGYICDIYPYESRHLSLLLSIIFCFTFILVGLWLTLCGEITSSFTWVMFTWSGFHLLESLYKPSLMHINMRFSLVIRYSSRRYRISFRLTGILLVLLMISTLLITYTTQSSQNLAYMVYHLLNNELLSVHSVSSFSITVDNGLESSDSIDWSHLPPDLAPAIVNRMSTYKDYIAAKGVWQDWPSARSSISRGPLLPLPALMLSEPVLTDMRTLFSLYDNSHHRLQLSEVRGKRIWGSQHGWVVALGFRYVTQLVHLMTGNQINLPKIQRLAPQEEWFCLVNKFNLLKDPTDESTFLVIAIFGPTNILAFTRVRLGAALNRRGEGEWVVVANPENLNFMDITHFNDQIYALCDNGKLVRFEPDAPLADMVQVIADHPQDVGLHRKIYLVESLGNLYGLFRNGFLIPSECRFETTSFFVYKFNFNASDWEEMTHLEGQTFFIGDGNSFSWRFPTSIIPSRSDCIYFTDGHWVWRKFPRKAYGGHDVGLFDMATRDILPLKFGKDIPRFYSRPIFVTRNDNL